MLSSLHANPPRPQSLYTSGLLIIILFSFYFLPPSFVQTAHVPAHAQPELLEWAQSHPQATVSVIIQKDTNAPNLEQKIIDLGGLVTKDLEIIHAFAAELPANKVSYAASLPGVRWISLDGPVERNACTECVITTNLKNTYNQAVNVDQVWNSSPYLQGQNIAVAIVDSGIYDSQDLYSINNLKASRIIASARFNSSSSTSADQFGHGTHIAGIVAGNGTGSNGVYIGMGPRANLVNIKVTDDVGMATESDVVAGLQWIYNNRQTYNIRVVNLSLNSSNAQSYHTSPLDAACEVLWFNGIVVVTSAGNNGTATLYPPANDPFVITVGAVDDKGTVSLQDDQMATFSAYGVTENGFAKPDLVAPGRNIVSLLAKGKNILAKQHPESVVSTAVDSYFRMSGTSVAAPIVTAAVALLLQDEPGLNPDQVKYRLLTTANKSWPNYDSVRAGAGYLDVYAAVSGTSTATANTNIPVSNLLTSGPNGVLSSSVNWSSVNWSSVNWSSVNWSSVNWSSVNWSSVNWSSDFWEPGTASTSTPTATPTPTPTPATTSSITPSLSSKSAMAVSIGTTPEAETTQAYRIFIPMITKAD